MPRSRLLVALAALVLLASACRQLVNVEVQEIELEPVQDFAQSFVYAADGSLIATFRFSHREPVDTEDLPRHARLAVGLAA